MNSLHLRLAIFVLRNHQRAIPDEPPNVKKQLRITHLILSLVVELPSWYNRNLFRVRIKRQKFQITALLYPISTKRIRIYPIQYISNSIYPIFSMNSILGSHRSLYLLLYPLLYSIHNSNHLRVAEPLLGRN